MLIRLLPDPPHPTILFAVTFQNPPEDLSLPWSWSTQLNALSLDDLELPQLVHSLDKAAGLVSILDQVSFNTPSRSISARFVDGSLHEWPLHPGCLKLLDSVLNDVNESASETEKERERLRTQEATTKEGDNLNSPPSSLKAKGHRKQRSLLMSLVASLVSPSSSPSKSSFSVPESPPPSPLPLPPQPPSLRPRALRRRARSTLVDAFRLYAQRELSARMPAGGFYTWIIQSMLHRSSDHLDQLVQCTGLKASQLLREEANYSRHTDGITTPYEEDGDLDTDTDGSSIRTPSSQFSHISFTRHSADLKSDPRPSASSDARADPQITECRALAATCVRLRHLLILANAQQVHAENEQKQKEAMLEIRSRRRAWLNKCLVGATSTNVGLAMPFKSSRLAQASWSSDDYEFAPEYQTDYAEYERHEDRLALGLRRTRGKSDAKLFPVTEEEEPECGGRDFEIQLPVDREDAQTLRRGVQVPEPRARTKSMHERHSDIKPSLEFSVVSSQPTSSILCQRLKAELDAPVYDAYDYVGDEFTLAMDVPLSVRMEDQAILSKRKVFPVSVMECEEGEWFTQPVAVDCR